ncbi:MAG: ATP-binding protein [Flavobacteriales bacterium]|nr:ATP-binding protein [Flavobacteriales bacterium]
MNFIHRDQEQRLRRLLRAFPGVLLTGPRQCGKSTMTKMALAGWDFFDLERPSDLSLLEADLEGFLDAHPKRLIIDEAQRMPALFSALRHAADKGKGKGRFVLLGSAGPALMRQVSESLAGRVGLMELTPFLSCELTGSTRAKDRWFWGGFPPVLALRDARLRGEWFAAYISTLLERDLPALGIGLPAGRLRRLWTMLTHVHGQLLNVSDLARSLGVSSHTVNGDLDVLEGAYMIRRLSPYHANVQKRLTKSSKLYLRDTGLLHFLAGLRKPTELVTWPKRGHSFEGLVIEELATLAHNRLVHPELFFWRTQAGAEVDLLIRDGRKVLPIEVKLGAAVDHRSVAGLRQCMADLGLKRGWVITSGTEPRTLSPEIEVVPWRMITTGEIDLF